MRQQKIADALISVDLVLDARKSVSFVFVNLVIQLAPALLDRVDDLLGF